MRRIGKELDIYIVLTCCSQSNNTKQQTSNRISQIPIALCVRGRSISHLIADPNEKGSDNYSNRLQTIPDYVDESRTHVDVLVVSTCTSAVGMAVGVRVAVWCITPKQKQQS